jgi:hypothetical protein
MKLGKNIYKLRRDLVMKCMKQKDWKPTESVEKKREIG